MTLDITYYDSPIDVMYVIHHASRAEAAEAARVTPAPPLRRCCTVGRAPWKSTPVSKTHT